MKLTIEHWDYAVQYHVRDLLRDLFRPQSVDIFSPRYTRSDNEKRKRSQSFTSLLARLSSCGLDLLSGVFFTTGLLLADRTSRRGSRTRALTGCNLEELFEKISSSFQIIYGAAALGPKPGPKRSGSRDGGSCTGTG